MLKPTDDECDTALAEAERMRDKDDDPHHLAKALHYLEHRVRYLEAVFDAAKNIFISDRKRKSTPGC